MEHEENNDPHSLIRRAKQGETEAFGELYNIYFVPVFRYVYYRVGSREEAEDIVQLVFLKVYEALPRYEATETPPLAYFFSAARNAVIDSIRKKKRVAPDEFDSIIDSLPSPEDTPYEVSLKEESKNAIGRLLPRLSEDQRDVVIMKYIGDLSYAEIASAMGKREDAVRQLHHRAVAALKSNFGEELKTQSA